MYFKDSLVQTTITSLDWQKDNILGGKKKDNKYGKDIFYFFFLLLHRLFSPATIKEDVVLFFSGNQLP